jgi:hypothetical protein
VWLIKEAKNGTAPASTTTWANSGECLHISESALAEILFSDISGSYTQRTNKGTAPASDTAFAKSNVCLDMLLVGIC